jgi:hypothetical protein
VDLQRRHQPAVPDHLRALTLGAARYRKEMPSRLETRRTRRGYCH